MRIDHTGALILVLVAWLAGCDSPAAGQEDQGGRVAGAPEARLAFADADAASPIETQVEDGIQALIARHGTPLERSRPTDVTIRGQAYRMAGGRFPDDPATTRFVMARGGGSRVCLMSMPHAQMSTQLTPTGMACVAALEGSSDVAAAAPRAEPSAPAANQANWSGVQGVYFRSISGVGVGGMFTMDFEPLILFTDGTYFEIDDTPLEDIDLATSRRDDPRQWGRWRMQGESFVLTGSTGRSSDYELQQGSFFKAFDARGGNAALSGTYKSVSGGGNSAMGGDVTIAVSSDMTFTTDGRFANARSVGALNSGATSGVGSSVGADRRSAGRYVLDRHTLTIERSDGQTERRFFAFGSSDTPAKLDRDMIFVGDTVYVLDD